MRNILIILILSLTISLFIGSRSLDIGKDTLNYYYFYEAVLRGSLASIRISEPVFLNIAKLFVFLDLNFNVFLTFISFISVFFLFFSYLKLYKRDGVLFESKNLIFIFAVASISILSPFFWSSQLNIIRSGLSIPFIYLSIYYLMKGRTGLFIVWGGVATLCHYSSLIYVILLFIFNGMQQRKFYKIFFLIVLGYLLGVNEIIFRSFSDILIFDNVYSGYLEEDTEISEKYKIGIRYDFAFFSLFFIFIFWFLLKKYNISYYNSLLKNMCILTIPFFLIGTIPFSDRLLYPFWMFIPFIVSIFFIEIGSNKNYYYLICVNAIFLFFLFFIYKLDNLNLI